MAQLGPEPVPAASNLPNLWKLPAKEAAGPTPWSNWVIRDRVIAGAYPASLDDAETERILKTLLELGINTFVCLQAEVNINTPDHLWRSGHGLRPYIKDAQKILSRAHETGNPRITQQKIDFLHLPIIDGNVTTDSAMNRLAEDCVERVIRGEKLYVHCWGGHGRTGTLISIMLGRLYNLPYTAAMRYCQAFHDSRIYPQGVRSPQTPVQRAQVRRILTAQPQISNMPMSAPPAAAIKAGGGYPAAIKAITTPQASSQPRAVPGGYGSAPRPYASILTGGGNNGGGGAARGGRDVGSLNDAAAALRVPASPGRGRQPANGQILGGSPAKAEVPRSHRSSSGSGGAAADRLAADFKLMQSPSAAASQQPRLGISYSRR